MARSKEFDRDKALDTFCPRWQNPSSKMLGAKAQGIYVGEVVVTRTVTTVKDNNDPALIESRAVAATFWEMYQNRDSISVTV